MRLHDDNNMIKKYTGVLNEKNEYDFNKLFSKLLRQFSEFTVQDQQRALKMLEQNIVAQPAQSQPAQSRPAQQIPSEMPR